MIWVCIGIVAFVIAAGYFAGVETGMYSINRLRVRFRAEQGQRGAIILQRLASDMERVVATTLVGSNLAIYAATAIVTEVLHARGEVHPELLATLLLTPASFIIAELLPKDLFARRREALMCPLAGSLAFFTWLLWPIVSLLRGLVGLLLRILRRPRSESEELFSRQGLMFSLADAAGLGNLTPTQRRMAHNIMQIEQLTVADAARPLSSAEVISVDTIPSQFLEHLRWIPFSRFPVYEGSRSHIIGTVYVFDLLYRQGELGESLRPYVKPPVLLDRRMRLYAALMQLRAARQRMGIVLDGSRPVALVTVNDLVQHIIGKLEQQSPHSQH